MHFNSAKQKPNLVVFITDQQQAGMLGCAGDPLLRTPNIDQIANGGSRFDRFYVAMPSCMPNRASILTTKYPSINGVRFNGIPLPEDSDTFVERFRQAGYKTALVGKAHHQPFLSETVEKSATDKRGMHSMLGGNSLGGWRQSDWWRKEMSWSDFSSPRPYYGFDHVDLVTGHGDTCGGAYEAWLRTQNSNYKSLIGERNQFPHSYSCPQASRTKLPAELYSTSYIAQKAQDFIERHSAINPNQPFLLVVSFPDPHHPFTPPGKYWDMYDPADVTLPDCFDLPENPPPHLRAVIDERRNRSAKLGGYGAVHLTEQETREAIALTYGMITMIDDAVGTVRSSITKRGISEKTVQVFTSDHGDLLGSFGMMLKGPLHYQNLIRVPCIVNDPELTNQPPVLQDMYNSLDLGASLLERAGVSPVSGSQGVSFWPSLTQSGHGRDAVMIEDEYRFPLLCFNEPTRLRTLVTSRWRLTVFTGCEWGELYDLSADPCEANNLWSCAAHSNVRSDLIHQLSINLSEACDSTASPRALG